MKKTLKIKGRSRGNVKAQRKRKQQRQKVPRTKNEYWCIDGNFTVHPLAYCTYYHGVLTQGLMDTHHCKEKGCHRLREGDSFE